MNDPELKEAFLAEAAEHLASVEDDIIALEKGDADQQTVNHLFRALHTVKGSSSFLSLPNVTALAHELENVVGQIRSKTLAVDEAVTDALLKGIDKLKTQLKNLDAGPGDVDIAVEMVALGRIRAQSGRRAKEKKPEEPRQATPRQATPPVPSARPAPPASSGQDYSGVAESSAVRISLHLLDKLMNLATELVLVRNQNIQAVENGDRQQLLTIAQRLNVVTSELQATIMQTRMRPVGGVFGKFNRITRDLAKKLGKELELEIIGSDVELDKNIVEAINDPLTHLIRNAVDHGIEGPDERERARKPRKGRIVLSAYHQAGQVHIRVEDDGKGIDPEKLRQAALLKDLINREQAETMSDRDAFNLIFSPGLSLAETVTDLSGRGVGMDVVKEAFKKLGGAIEVSSALGKGTAITIKLPLTVAIVPTLVVAVEKSCFAIPQVNIDEIVWLYGSDVYQKLMRVDDQEVYWLRGKLLPILRLSKLLGVSKTYSERGSERPQPDRRADGPDRRNLAVIETPEEAAAEPPQERRDGQGDRRTSIVNNVNIVVLKLGEERFGLLVDRIVDTEEIVVKRLHEQLKSCGCFAGTTVLGDGRIAMILDIASLVELGRLRLGNTEPTVPRITSSQQVHHTALLFNIGGRETFAVPLPLILRVEEIAANKVHYANGQEYFEYQGKVSPLVRLEKADPTLQTSYGDRVLYAIVPKSRRPVGVLAASILDTFETPADIDCETVSREGFFGSALIDGRLTLFVDLFTMIERVVPGFLADQRHPDAAQRRVLLVEDSALFAGLIVPHLKNAGYEVVHARNGSEGLAELGRQPFDFVVSDLEMPVMDGLEFARRVRATAAYGRLPMLAISSMNDDAAVANSRKAGFDRFESKLSLDAMLAAMLVFGTQASGPGRNAS